MKTAEKTTQLPAWKVQLKGDIHHDSVHIYGEPLNHRQLTSYELSVVRTSNSHGQMSYGWDDETKIILPELHGRHPRKVAEMVRIANVLCVALNAAEPDAQDAVQKLMDTAPTTHVIAGYEMSLQSGCRYLASMPDGDFNRTTYPVSIRLQDDSSSDIGDSPVFITTGLSYAAANELLAEFNNEETSFTGRVWE